MTFEDGEKIEITLKNGKCAENDCKNNFEKNSFIRFCDYCDQWLCLDCFDQEHKVHNHEEVWFYVDDITVDKDAVTIKATAEKCDIHPGPPD